MVLVQRWFNNVQHIKARTLLQIKTISCNCYVCKKNTMTRTNSRISAPPLRCSRTFLAKWVSFDTHGNIDHNIMLNIVYSHQYLLSMCYFSYIFIIYQQFYPICNWWMVTEQLFRLLLVFC